MSDWSELEVELIIGDYFQMLHLEIGGMPYNKTEHRNSLLKFLPARSHSSIEFKHQNISAVLVEHGLPYISGYKPRGNYQKLLEERVLSYVSRNQSIESDFNAFAIQTVAPQILYVQYNKWLAPPPETNLLNEPVSTYHTPVKKNYLELEQRNQSIGLAGEELVFEYEKWRLRDAGLPKLAKEVKWISRDEGDGAGYDILSKTRNGTNMFIEVKTTTLGKDAPIFFSKTENDFSNETQKAYHLYRVFNLKKKPQLFTLSGKFSDICVIEPTVFKGTF